MYITCNIKGGLGNQLFQIVTTESMAKQSGRIAFYTPIPYSASVFEPRPTYWDSLFKNLQTAQEYPQGDCETIREKNYRYDDTILSQVKNSTKTIVVLDGYFQSHKYFDSYNVFEKIFTWDLMNLIPDALSSIAIHIRIGDYAKLSGNVLTHLWDTPYYSKACAQIKSFFYPHDNSPLKYTVFTDTASTVEQIAGYLRIISPENISIFSENVQNYYPLWPAEYRNIPQDVFELLCMSRYRHIILANSSFSWWAAYIYHRDTFSPGMVTYSENIRHHNMFEPNAAIYTENWFGISRPYGEDIADLCADIWTIIPEK